MGHLGSNLLNGGHKNIVRQQTQPVKGWNKIEPRMCARLCIPAALPIKNDRFHHAASCRTVALALFFFFLRAFQRSGSLVRGSQRGRRVISKLKRSRTKGVTQRRISVTSCYNVAHNWLGCCPDCVFISPASHTQGCISGAGADDLHVFGAAARRCWWWRLHHPNQQVIYQQPAKVCKEYKVEKDLWSWKIHSFHTALSQCGSLSEGGWGWGVGGLICSG